MFETDNPLIVYGIMLLIFLFAGSLFFGVRIRHRSGRDKEEPARLLGFSVFKGDRAELMQRLSQVFDRSTIRLEMENVFYRQRSGAELYLFDLRDINSSEAFWFAEDALLIVSPDLSLPRFTLLPRPETMLAMTGISDWLIQRTTMLRVGRLGHRRVHFPESPWFEKRFIVTGLDEAAIRQVLTPVRRSQLVQYAQDLEFFAVGDMLASRRVSQTKQITLDQLRLLVNKTMAVYEILR